MKKLMVSIAVALLTSVSLASASNIVSTPAASYRASVSQEKVEIKPEELPDAVRTALGAEPYNEWQVQKAFLVPGENESQTFEITLSKGEETTTAKFDKDGKVIE